MRARGTAGSEVCEMEQVSIQSPRGGLPGGQLQGPPHQSPSSIQTQPQGQPLIFICISVCPSGLHPAVAEWRDPADPLPITHAFRRLYFSFQWGSVLIQMHSHTPSWQTGTRGPSGAVKQMWPC